MKQELWEKMRQSTGGQTGGKKRKGTERGIEDKREQETTERRGGRDEEGRGYYTHVLLPGGRPGMETVNTYS